MQIIPAIDIIGGQCVRLTKGDFERQTVYNSNPAAVASQFERAGFQRLHLVDLDGAKAGQTQNLAVLKSITAATSLQVDFSGGITSTAAVEAAFEAGAAYVAIGSIAVKNPPLLAEWVQQFGAERFLVGADVLHEQIKISGWLEDGGLDIYTFLQQIAAIGIEQVFCTDISKDGAMAGPAIGLYEKIMQHFPQLRLIASGGVSNMADVHQLKAIGCSGAIIGKAIYEGAVSLDELITIHAL